MLDLAYNHEGIRQWVSNELGVPVAPGEDVRSIGVIHDGDLVAGIVYHDYTGFMVQCSLATTDKAWCQKGVIRAMMNYPFKELGVTRFHATCAKKNKKMRKLFEGLGFKYEGCARKAFDGVQDAMIYSILRDENKWMN